MPCLLLVIYKLCRVNTAIADCKNTATLLWISSLPAGRIQLCRDNPAIALCKNTAHCCECPDLYVNLARQVAVNSQIMPHIHGVRYRTPAQQSCKITAHVPAGCCQHMCCDFTVSIFVSVPDWSTLVTRCPIMYWTRSKQDTWLLNA